MYKYLTLFLAIIASTLMLVAAPAHAQSSSESIDRTVFATSNTNLEQDVNGDVYCFNEATNIRSTVSDDVLCASGEVHIYGTVAGDARLLAENVTIHGTIEGNLSVVAGKVTIEDGATIGGDVSGVAQTMVIEGVVQRDIVATAANMTIRGSVLRDVNTTVENLTIAESATITGWVRHYNATTVNVDPNATVSTVKAFNDSSKDNAQAGAAAALALGLLALGLFSIFIALIAPRIVHTATADAYRKPLVTLLIGAAVCVALPIMALAFTLSGLLSLFGILLVALWAVILLVSAPIGMYTVAYALLRDQTSNIAVLALIGAGIGISILVIPVVNVLFVLFILLFGAGAITQQIGRMVGKPNYRASPTKKDS